MSAKGSTGGGVHRNLLGEDLAPLSSVQLDQLESQVCKTLRQIRSRKVNLFFGKEKQTIMQEFSG